MQLDNWPIETAIRIFIVIGLLILIGIIGYIILRDLYATSSQISNCCACLPGD
jgi:hypothetical protein